MQANIATEPPPRPTRRGPSRKVWFAIAGVAALVGVALVTAAAALYADHRAEAREVVLVDEVSGAAFGCVASLRGDAPESWSLELSLEHMARHARLLEAPVHGDDASRAHRVAVFDAAATNAVDACARLSDAMSRAQAESPELYFAVPTRLAQAPDRERAAQWYRRALPQSRDEAQTFAAQIAAMAEAINARRRERALMPRALLIEGRGPPRLARLIELPPIPGETGEVQNDPWPTVEAVFVIRRVVSATDTECADGTLRPNGCVREYIQRVTWSGEVGPPARLPLPRGVARWIAFALLPDSTLLGLGASRSGAGAFARMRPVFDASGAAEVPIRARVSSIRAPVDDNAGLAGVIGGVAIFDSRGSAWLEDNGTRHFERVGVTPRPIIAFGRAGSDGAATLTTLLGSLTIYGSEAEGWTSRFVTEGEPDALCRVIDAHRQVDGVQRMRSLQGGRVVALVSREGALPDALIFSDDLGRSWLADEPSDS